MNEGATLVLALHVEALASKALAALGCTSTLSRGSHACIIAPCTTPGILPLSPVALCLPCSLRTAKHKLNTRHLLPLPLLLPTVLPRSQRDKQAFRIVGAFSVAYYPCTPVLASSLLSLFPPGRPTLSVKITAGFTPPPGDCPDHRRPAEI